MQTIRLDDEHTMTVTLHGWDDSKHPPQVCVTVHAHKGVSRSVRFVLLDQFELSCEKAAQYLAHSLGWRNPCADDMFFRELGVKHE